MAATTQIEKPKTASKTKAKRTPWKEMSDSQKRAYFGEQTSKLLANLERSGKKLERLMKRNVASEGQRKALQAGVDTLTARIVRAAKGETSASNFSVPTE